MVRSGSLGSSVRLVAALAAVCVAAALAGCAKSTVVPSTGPRSPTLVGQVKIFEKPPKKYEVLGTVTVTREEGAMWDEKGDANKGFETLLTKAAALGATGLLLDVPADQLDRRAVAGHNGVFYQVPVKGKPGAALAQAIYVHEE